MSTTAVPHSAARAPAPQDPDAELADPFTLISIQPVAAPSGAAGAWHRYEIVQGKNTIVGYRAGGMRSVTEAVESIVEQLNDRRAYRRPRTHIVLDRERKRNGDSK